MKIQMEHTVPALTDPGTKPAILPMTKFLCSRSPYFCCVLRFRNYRNEPRSSFERDADQKVGVSWDRLNMESKHVWGALFLKTHKSLRCVFLLVLFGGVAVFLLIFFWDGCQNPFFLKSTPSLARSSCGCRVHKPTKVPSFEMIWATNGCLDHLCVHFENRSNPTFETQACFSKTDAAWAPCTFDCDGCASDLGEASRTYIYI